MCYIDGQKNKYLMFIICLYLTRYFFQSAGCKRFLEGANLSSLDSGNSFRFFSALDPSLLLSLSPFLASDNGLFHCKKRTHLLILLVPCVSLSFVITEIV
jgi:hypothetical protein